MGESTGLPAINEIAFFLNEFAPTAVDALAKRGSQYAELLRIGVAGRGKRRSTRIGKGKGIALPL